MTQSRTERDRPHWWGVLGLMLLILLILWPILKPAPPLVAPGLDFKPVTTGNTALAHYRSGSSRTVGPVVVGRSRRPVSPVKRGFKRERFPVWTRIGKPYGA